MSDLFVISGMTGMTGNEVARQVLASGHQVIGFDNFFASSEETIADLRSNENLTFFEGDLNNAEQMLWLKKKVLECIDDHQKVIYINCAAVVHTEHFYKVHNTFETNVLGMKSFLEQAIEVNADVFINCSTSEVYSMESWKEGGMREDDYLVLATAEHSQRTSYAAGKIMTEFFLKDAVDAGRIKGCSLRFANVYSENELYPKHIIPYVITSLMEDGRVTLLENSKVNRRTFLHNFDSCSAVLALVDAPEALDGTVYNVATEEEKTIIELVNLCGKYIGLEKPKIEFEGYRSADPERRILSTEKIRTRTSWKPSIPLEKGIQMCVEYRRKKQGN